MSPKKSYILKCSVAEHCYNLLIIVKYFLSNQTLQTIQDGIGTRKKYSERVICFIFSIICIINQRPIMYNIHFL